MSALLETLKYKPDSLQAGTTNEDFGTEGKFGIPRFGGDPATLPEYTYRVMTRLEKEGKMSKEEVQKLGPLGLRLVEGLRGPALRLAQQVDIKTLGGDGGPKALLKVFHETLKPRKIQEARELYSAGAREGGPMARQLSEPMSSYVSRRRAWWAALQGLDAELKIPEMLLAEQVLTNSGLSLDQQLMVRTMLQGKMTVDAIAEELLSQHPNIHEKEKYHRHSKGSSKGGWKRNHRSGFGGGFRGFHAESTAYGEDEEWSEPTGFTAFEDEVMDGEDEQHGNHGLEGYAAEAYYEEDDENYTVMGLALLVDSGLDLSSDEACALAAESLQLEHEAYMLRHQGKGKGHHGFSQQRQFDISGSVSFQERKARLAQLKSRTECRRCGQKGHWSGDASCPKGSGKRASSPTKKGFSPSSRTSNTSGSGGKGNKTKPRVVYFSMVDNSGPGSSHDGVGFMALHHNEVPPPSSLDAGTTSGTRPMTSLQSSSASGFAPISMLSSISLPPSASLAPATMPAPSEEDMQRIRELNEVIRQANERTGSSGPGGSRETGSVGQELPLAVRAEDRLYANVLDMLHHMEVDEEEVSKAGVNPHGVYGSEERQRYLDFALTVLDPTHPEFGVTYGERWNEFVPGHPLFLESDKKTIEEYMRRCLEGRPHLPIEAMRLFDGEQKQLGDQSQQQVPSKGKSTTKMPIPLSMADPSSTTTRTTCSHSRTTRKGTNKYYELETCLDCHEVIRREKKEETTTSTTTARPTPKRDPTECKHSNTTWKGSNGIQWRQTCLDCGKRVSGYHGARGPHQSQGLIGESSTMTPSSTSGGGTSSLTMGQVQEIFRICLVVANVKAMESEQQVLDGKGLHRILDAVMTGASTTPAIPTTSTSTQSQPPPLPSQPPLRRNVRSHPKDNKRMTFGEYKNYCYELVYLEHYDYVVWAVENVRPSSCKGMKDFVEYCREKRVNMEFAEDHGYMAIEASETSETHLIAILDMGCNKTCHGDRWLQRYQAASGVNEVPLEPDQGGGFRGIGGKIGTTGVRHLQVSFELENGHLAVGDLKSVELEDSDAPLLLSIDDQRKLGLQVTLESGGDKVYSSTLKSYLSVADYNGLLGIRLLPSDLALLGLGKTDQEAALDFDAADATPTTTVEDQDVQGDLLEEDPADFTEVFLSIEDEKRRSMTKGQKKNFEQSVKEIETTDECLWSTLRGKDRLAPLPRGCQVFLMEIFAGAAMLTSMALSMGLEVAAPVDIKFDGSDLLRSGVRSEIEKEIDRLDPYCLTFAPVCGPWGPWSRLNMAKSEQTCHDILQQRDAWHPCLQWIKKVVRNRLKRGRKVIMENPWSSEIWSTLCIDKLIQEAPCDAETGERLELIRGDQCEYGLVDAVSGIPHQKPTGFLTASAGVKETLSRRCSGLHQHQPLEGGQRTRRAQEWTPQLCKAMLSGLMKDMKERTVMAAFEEASHEEAMVEEYDLGSFDYVQDDKDVGRSVDLPGRVNDEELQLQESWEEMASPVELMAVETERKAKWLRAPKEVRIALRRLHCMTGHGSTSSMIQMLRTAGASAQVLEVCRHFACETCRKRQGVQRPPTVKEPNRLVFNYEVSGDCFEVQDSVGNRHTILSVICLGTLYHQAFWVAPGGVPKSQICAEAFLQGWLQPFGAPQVFTCDRGVHNQGRFRDLLRIHGIRLRYAGLEAPHQIGRTERQGGILKDIIKSAVEEQQVIGVQDMKMLVMECTMVKNSRLNHHGFSPAQWVLGKLPREVTSLTSEEATAVNVGVQEDVMESEDIFARQLMIRQSAKMAYGKVDSSRRIRAALLRKSVPLRGPYAPGDLVCFYRRGRWHGPGRIIGKEGRSTFWIVHAGIPVVVAENQIRPATTKEVMAKQLLGLRGKLAIKRKRDDGRGEEALDETPFGEDLRNPMQDEDESQPSYLELPEDIPGPQNLGGLSPPPGFDGLNGPALAPHQPDLSPPDPPVPELPGLMVTPEAMEQTLPDGEEETPVIDIVDQPESEQAPSNVPTIPPTPTLDRPPTGMPLTEALRRSVRALDGLPDALPGRERQRSRSPHRSAEAIPVPRGGEDALMANHKQRGFDAFFARRIYKKKRQVGAGREVNYKKSEPEVKQRLDVTRKKEWGNWNQFGAVQVLLPEMQEQFFRDNPEAEVIPTRWVDTDKSEPDQPSEYKSRLVARGDLEQNNQLRTDSPTTSQLFLNLIISYSASKKKGLKGGDISAAFLQGAGIQRKLVLRPPEDGVPDEKVRSGSLLLCNKSVYGTKIAPRGFWKQLHDDILACGLREVPQEPCAYYMPGEKGQICGLMGTHVDDLLWCGNDDMDAAMEQLQMKYNFRLTTSDEFKFCGRIIKQDKKGIYVTCPSVLDRVKNIFLSPQRRKQRGEMATNAEISQLRSVVGSLSWYSRTCRPDLAYGVNQLQSVQQRARVEDLVTANRLLSHALATKERGVFFASDAFEIENAMVISINDASHGASFDVGKDGEPVGHRSQTGRLLALGSEEFGEKGDGQIHLLAWSSNVIKRVCRSTLQAEAMSLQLGSEDAEHVRQVLYVIKNLATEVNPSKNYIPAMDHARVLWLTDCRSLSDHLCNPCSSEVSDKRLAIDLTSLRQELWREEGQLVGNPTYTDKMPETSSTKCLWISTKTMAADGLTKHMKCSQLEDLMYSGQLQVDFENPQFMPIEDRGV